MRTFLRVLVPAVALTAFVAAGGIDVPTAAQAKKAKEEKDAKDVKAPAAGAKFELTTDKRGDVRFKLVDGEGKTVFMCVKGYDSKAEAQAVIEYIRKEVAKAKVEDDTKAGSKTKEKE
jgi:uncharacterized protein YegP (UPF0339 family)